MFKKSDFELYELPIKAPIFSTILKNHVELNKYLKQVILEHRHHNPETNKSNVKAWHSSWMTHEENPKFLSFCDLVLDICKFVIKEYHDDIHEFVVTNMWTMMYEESDYTRSHDHFPSLLSVCYYVDVEDGSSPIIFDDNTPNKLTIYPENGMLLLWKSDIRHVVPPTKTKRMVISMNINSKL